MHIKKIFVTLKSSMRALYLSLTSFESKLEI